MVQLSSPSKIHRRRLLANVGWLGGKSTLFIIKETPVYGCQIGMDASQRDQASHRSHPGSLVWHVGGGGAWQTRSTVELLMSTFLEKVDCTGFLCHQLGAH